MKFIVYEKKTLKVLHILDKEPISITDNLAVARCENIPQGDILTVTNIQPKTEKYIVKEPKIVEIKDEATGEVHEETKYVEVEKEREFFTCDIVGTVDEKKVVRNSIIKLKNWFNTNYRMYNEMLTRRKALGIEKACDDKVRGKVYSTLGELYQEAEKVVEEINQLETQLI